MAVSLVRKNYQTQVCHYVADTVDDIDMLPTTKRGGVGTLKNNPIFLYAVSMGSTCEVSSGEFYKLFSDGWKKRVTLNSGSGAGGESMGNDGENIEFATDEEVLSILYK